MKSDIEAQNYSLVFVFSFTARTKEIESYELTLHTYMHYHKHNHSSSSSTVHPSTTHARTGQRSVRTRLACMRLAS